MGDWWWLVHTAVFVAALIQAATGLGFGLIAGPVLLLALGDLSAIQITILLSLMIALVLSPPLFKHADRSLLKQLLIGTGAGLPVGILIYLHADLGTLQLLAGIVVAMMGISVPVAKKSATPSRSPTSGDTTPADTSSAAPAPGSSAPWSGPGLDRGLPLGAGALCGIMTASLAMPGPAPAALMAARDHEKTVIRATMLSLFVPAYAAALALQVSVATVSVDTCWTTATLVPAALIGLGTGAILASRIDEGIFVVCIALLLLSTGVALLISGLGLFSS